ncbi:MAG: tetratricopeptide repeat protein [Vicingaceae bacterium]|nr:tetratricopeptide repeat protein [Vicingaceae bacterium]
MLNLFFTKKISILKMLLFLLFIQLFFSNSIKANEEIKLDSIINYANSFKNDTDKINAYFKYDDYIYRYSPKLDSALNRLIVFLCDSNLKKSQLSDKEKNNFYNQKARSFNNLGLYFKNLANIDSAIHYFDKCLEIYEEIDNKFKIATTYTNICNTYLITDDYENALKYIYKSREINIESNNKKGLISVKFHKVVP